MGACSSRSNAYQTPRLSPVTLESPRSLQETTTMRLPTWCQQRFCEPCKAFLRGDRTECLRSDQWEDCDHPEYLHHLDAESFKRALELPCAICIRLYKAFQRPFAHGVQTAYSIGSTRYSVVPLRIIPFLFLSSAHRAIPTLEPYESKFDLRYQHFTQNTGDAQALSFFKIQYEKCRKQHLMCQRRALNNKFTPTRAVYVGSPEDEEVYLCDGVEMIPGASYTVLSHCWGKNPQQVMLTECTVKMLKEGIALPSLPKTFQDAIAVTRTFKIQYIWIDSLCIFQDNLDDWAAEASRMRDVYNKAEICIAATGARSGDIGLFLNRSYEQCTPVMVEATWSGHHDLSNWLTPGLYLFGFHHVSVQQAIDEAPLNQRAWVAQERFLSQRILHFTESVLFWECLTSLASENDTEISVSHFGLTVSLKKRLNDFQWLDPGVGNVQEIILPNAHNDARPTNSREVYQSWCIFLSYYTSCGITKESDILVAIVGVADEVGHVIGDKLVAGLWKANFIEELCWRSWGETSRPDVWRAPSWSWASLSGRVQPPVIADLRIPYCMAAVIELDISTKASGEVEWASALVECRPVSATVHYKASEGRNSNALITSIEGTWTPSNSTNLGRYGSLEVQLDVPNSPCYCANQAVDVQLLVLLKQESTNFNSRRLEGICVVNSRNQLGAFERIGYFRAEDGAVESMLAAYNQALVQEILLV